MSFMFLLIRSTVQKSHAKYGDKWANQVSPFYYKLWIMLGDLDSSLLRYLTRGVHKVTQVTDRL